MVCTMRDHALQVHVIISSRHSLTMASLSQVVNAKLLKPCKVQHSLHKGVECTNTMHKAYLQILRSKLAQWQCTTMSCMSHTNIQCVSIHIHAAMVTKVMIIAAIVDS